MRRDVRKRHVLVHVFATEAEFFAMLKFKIWHSPTTMEPNTFYKIVVPMPPAKVLQGDVFNGTGVPVCEYASLMLDTVAQEMTLKVPVAQFNASKRKRGAALGTPPPSADGAPRKFDLLSQMWVPLTTRAPKLGALKRAFSGLMSWVFW